MARPLSSKPLRARAERRSDAPLRPLEPPPSEPAAPLAGAPADTPVPSVGASPRPRVDPTLLDEAVLGRLRQLEAMGAPGLLAATVQAFLARAPKRLEHLQSLSLRPLRRELAQEAQALAVNCGGVGAVRVRELCLALVQAAPDADATTLQGQVEALRAALSRTAEALARVAGP